MERKGIQYSPKAAAHFDRKQPQLTSIIFGFAQIFQVGSLLCSVLHDSKIIAYRT